MAKMQKKYRKKGSITVFLTMLLLLIASFFFALLEISRIKGLHTKAELVEDVAMESVFAEYQREIYEDYGLLLLDGAYGGESFQIQTMEYRLEEMVCKNLYDDKEQGVDFYQMNVVDCQIPRYQLVTDQGGASFRSLAADAAKQESAASLLEDFTEEITQKRTMEEENGSVEDYLKAAEKAKEEAAKKKEEESTSNQGGSESSSGNNNSETSNNSASNTGEDVENPIEEIKSYRKSRVLSMVVRNEENLSKKAISTEETLEHRQLEKGNLKVDTQFLDEMWFLKYLESHYGCYGRVLPDRALDYEMEYILQGKGSDAENIEGVAKNLIKIREISNLAYLAKDAKKQAEAGELAVALMGWTLLEPVIAATKWGILASWAYVESVLDVRALLEGRRIAWMKTGEQWTSGLGGMKNTMDGFVMSKDCENGWDYTRYLQFLLCLKKDSGINYRSMDLIEVNINNTEDLELHMDHMVVACKGEVDYEAEPLFWKYVYLGNQSPGTFTMKKKKRYSYSD